MKAPGEMGIECARLFLEIASLTVLHFRKIEASVNFRAVCIANEIDTFLVFGDGRFAVAGLLGKNEGESLDFLAVRSASNFNFRWRNFLFGFLVNQGRAQL